MEENLDEKPLVWIGKSLEDLKETKTFSDEARREAGKQLSQVQFGQDPDHWKPFSEVGPGTREIIVDTKDGWNRVMYVAKFEEAVYVLHCFKKKSNATSKVDKEIAKNRYALMLNQRNEK